MMAWENLKMAFASIGQAKLRSFLTMLGIIIGVAAVVAITSIGQGVKNSVTNRISGLGATTLTIVSGDKSSRRGGGGGSFGPVAASTLTNDDVTRLESVPGVAAASAVSGVAGTLTEGKLVSLGATIEATAPSYGSIVNLSLARGRYFTASDPAASVVIGSTSKTDLFGTANAIGQTVQIQGKYFTVIGILAPSSSLFGSDAANIIAYIPTAAVSLITPGVTPSVSEISVKVANSQEITPTVNRINAALKQAHDGRSDFTVYTQADLLSTFNSILSILTTFIAAIAAISLLVGGIGIMNIMLVSVTERTREIGLRKAIGATSSTVLGQFLIEAIILSLFGGALGLAAAYGLATVAGHLAGITPGFSLSSVLLAVGVSAGVGIVFGIAPAIQAARKRPIQALKAE